MLLGMEGETALHGLGLQNGFSATEVRVPCMTSGWGRMGALAAMALVVVDCLVTNLTDMADTGYEFLRMFEERN